MENCNHKPLIASHERWNQWEIDLQEPDNCGFCKRENVRTMNLMYYDDGLNDRNIGSISMCLECVARILKIATETEWVSPDASAGADTENSE